MKKNYTNQLLVFVMALFFSTSMLGQNSSALWTKTSKEKTSNQDQIERRSQPAKAEFYQLNIEALRSVLQNVPERGPSVVSDVVINFPNIDGTLEAFRVMESSVMHPELQANYPEISTYVGQSLDNPASIMRFSVTPKGLHTMTLNTKYGTQYVEPFATNDVYMAYARRDLPARTDAFECGVTDELQFVENYDLDLSAARNANDGLERVYDLALGSSANYTNFHGGTVANGLAAMVVTMNRVNGIYMRDFSVRMEMVANNNLLVSTSGNVIFGNDVSVINTATGTINGIIGAGAYDIGHVFTTGAGGLAGLGVVCTANKGAGITGINAPVGDVFDVDFVSHEMGHQFGGNHSFNGSTGACAGGNRNAATAYEPGSGSTIMAYAGICSPQNVQNNSDDYFHRISIAEISANILTGAASGCATTSASGNNAPTAEAGNSYSIPISTPYKLTGSSTDPDGSTAAHVYTWEQYDLGPAGIPADNTATGPTSRSREGTTSPSRYIPRLQDVLSNGGNSTFWERLNSVGRDLNFELTVRDMDPNGGQTASDNMVATTIAAAGPFEVLSQNTNVTWTVGTSETVTWDVANTTAAPVSTANVNILLSADGGTTFPFVLASNVPNDGSHVITVPGGAATNLARLIVEGAGNIFYAVNATNFTVEGSDTILNFTNSTVDVCQPNDAVYNFTYETFGGFSETTVFSTTGAPAGASIVFNPTQASANGTAVTMTVSNTGGVALGSHSFDAVGTAPSATTNSNVTLNVSSGTLNAATLVSPGDGATDVSAAADLSWNADANAQDYLVEIATDAGFGSIVESANVATNSYTATMLGTNTMYFWRVTASNACATASASSTFSFTTANISCDMFTATDTPLTISASGVGNTVISTITIGPDFPITDVNVTINLPHTYVSDLDITLTSPLGTMIDLSSGNGGSGDNFTNTVFDQDAATSITAGTVPYTGSFIPEGDLSSLNGEMSAGNWTLTVVDNFNLDGGSLDEFTLELCVQGSLSIDENTLEGFSIFPNPNNGEFTVKFNSNSGEDTKISVYDIRGRSVFNEIYESAGTFNETVRLNSVQAGMYLVKISDGISTITKKIIVD